MRERFRKALSLALGNLKIAMSGEPKLSGGGSKSERPLLRLPPQSIVYWSRIGFAVLGGAIYNVSGLGEQILAINTLGAIAIGILVYAISVFTVKYILGYGPEVLTGPRKHISIGMGSYIIWLIFTMILFNTVLHPSPA